MSALKILQAGPGMSIQDQGRPGLQEQGVAQGGAADQLALAEGAALLGQDPSLAAIEMVGIGGTFEAQAELRIALTGAPMQAEVNGRALTWNASHHLETGQRLQIRAATSGVYGYLHLGGGVASPVQLGARATHLAAGIGRALSAGDVLQAGEDTRAGDAAKLLRVSPRFSGGPLRIVESFQSRLFAPEVRARFAQTRFGRGNRANRMGVELCSEGAGFQAHNQLSILSEVIVPGDVQMTGDGRPFVLMRECQTTGGYPRIGTVLPSDLATLAQADLGAEFQFSWITLAEALEIEARAQTELAALPSRVQPLVRDPAQMQDLLSYQLIGGMVSANENPFQTAGENG